MNDEIIWIGNIVRCGSNTPRYLYNDEKGFVEFRTMKDHKEIAYFDKKTGCLYLNSRYRMQFKAVKNQIIKDYKPNSISEYCTLV
jgi:hypothetical protein